MTYVIKQSNQDDEEMQLHADFFLLRVLLKAVICGMDVLINRPINLFMAVIEAKATSVSDHINCPDF